LSYNSAKNLQRQEVTAENCLMEDIKDTKITRTNCKTRGHNNKRYKRNISKSFEE
jgi:hypothetical protein